MCLYAIAFDFWQYTLTFCKNFSLTYTSPQSFHGKQLVGLSRKVEYNPLGHNIDVVV